jgi:drug/metabolite transporter (DMT)-like permease
VDAGVAAAVLAASLLHASWHALVKSSGDGVIALAGMNLVSAVVAIALLPFVQMPTAAAALVIAVSVLLHVGYKIALAHLYARADLSQGYPLARGLTPLFATLLGLLFLGEVPSASTLAGVIAISLGIFGLLFERGKKTLSAPSLGAAMAVGVTVAAYSVLDAYGVRINRDWLGFTVWLVTCDSAAFMAYAFATRGRTTLIAWRAAWGRTLVSGLLGVAAFAVFMWALGRAQVGAVTALRETSIIFAALLGALFLRESIGRARAVAAVLVMSGAAAIPLFR